MNVFFEGGGCEVGYNLQPTVISPFGGQQHHQNKEALQVHQPVWSTEPSKENIFEWWAKTRQKDKQ
jgi:hypothetical protein